MRWDDLRFALALARAGSASRAARQLGVNQTTVLRRIDALEAAVGSPLFERHRAGQTPTQAGRLIVEAATRIEREARELTDALGAAQRGLDGSVRLTTSEGLAGRLVTPCMRSFRRRYPGVSVELIIADERLDIARGEADVALRAGSRPEGAGIVARRMPDIGWTVYGSRAYADERGLPADTAALRGHDIVGLDGGMARLGAWRWLSTVIGDTDIRLRSNSFISLVSNLKAGLGLGVLPTIVGDAEPELLRCFPPPPELDDEMWLIVREAVRGHPAVRALAEFLAGSVREAIAAAAAEP